jgi:hypothetical protein
MLYRDLLGEDFALLPAPVQRLHDGTDTARFSGEINVTVGTHPIARLAARLARLPRTSGRHALKLTITRATNGEHWLREFGAARLASRQRRGAGAQLIETLGLARLSFQLRHDRGALVWIPVRIRVLGVPLPGKLLRAVSAREYALGERYAFEVHAALPLAGLLIAYQGTLDV